MGAPRPDGDDPPGYVLVANQAAGSVRERAVGDALAVLARVAPTELCLTARAGDLDDVLGSLDGRLLVVAGGDGSLHLAVNRLLALGLGHLALGLVPLGTGNDLARGLGLPLDAAAAAEVVVRGRATPMPVARRDGSDEVVVNNVHAGIGERAAALAVGLKPRLGPAAYPAGAVRAGLRPEVVPVVVRVDGREVHAGPALAVVAALGPSAGGGRRVAPDADPVDPVLDVVVVEGRTVRSRLAVAARVALGKDPAGRPDVGRWAGQVVEVDHPGRPSARWDLDGEPRCWPTPTRLSVEPAAWRLVR